MKKVLACIIVVLLLVSMMPAVHAASSTVYVSVSVDGKLEVAAQPLTVSDLSVDNILREAHKKFYPDGEEGYASGIDSMWNMFMIGTAWGIKATPYVILNEATLAAGADVTYAKDGDNIILVTSSDPSVIPQVVSMTAKSVGGNTTISALSWVLDFATFTYKSSPVVGAKVVDGNGNTLGTTDSTGSLNFAACAVAAIDGLAAIPADGSCNATKLNEGAPEPVAAPVEEPPVEETPVEQPPVEETPVEEPPAEEPPVEQPPVEETPVEEPPAEEPPVEQPPAEEPPVEQPPAEETPVEEPPAEEPPVEEPPAEETPVEEPPASEPAAPSGSGDVVYVSVSVDGKLEVAAQPLTVSDLCVDSILREAHKQFYPDGEAGYASGIDSTWNMFMIGTAWGVTATPYVILNEETLAAGADVSFAKPGDNIILVTSSDPAVVPAVVSMAAKNEGANTTISALSWTLDFTTFMYKSTPLANANVVDGAGNVLGTTDAAGNLTIAACPVAAIEGLAAIPADGSCNAVKTNPPIQDPSDYVGIPESEGVTVNFTVSVDGSLKVAAQKITVSKDNPTIEAVLKEAHKKWYATGEGGFGAGIDPTYNMYLINKFWGVPTTPYVMLNGTPLGADMSVPSSADTGTVSDGDQIVVSVVGTGQNIPIIAMVNDGGNLLVKEWSLDFMTFTYDSKSYSNADIIDPATGEVLGTTDGTGKLKMPTSESGVVAVPGLSAFAVGDAKEFTPTDTVFTPPALDYSLFGGEDGKDLLVILIYGLAMSIPMAIVIFIGGRKEIKNKGVKHFKKTW